MGRKIYQWIMLVFLMGFYIEASAVMVVTDPDAMVRFGSMILEARNQVQQLQGASNKLTNLNQILGNDNPRLAGIMNTANQWGAYLDGMSSLEADPLSVLNQLGYSRAGHNNYCSLIEMGRFVSDKLYVPRSANNEPTPISNQLFDNIKQERIVVLEKASVNGMAVSGKSKHELRQVQRKVAELGIEGTRTASVLEALITQNKLLSVIASELVQQREIQSQQLELLSAFITQGSALTTKTLPSRVRE